MPARYSFRVGKGVQRRADRVAKRAQRRAMGELCVECGHPWSEHLGAAGYAEEIGGCGECAYEIEHGFWEPRPLCRVRVPDHLLAGGDNENVR